MNSIKISQDFTSPKWFRDRVICNSYSNVLHYNTCRAGSSEVSLNNSDIFNYLE